MLEEKQEVNEQKTKEFKKRVDMLVLALSLKENDSFFEGKEGYQLLFSTYIKMIENDQEDFFIEKERKAKIIQSLERTKAFYDFERREQLQTVFGEMGNDDPTDFMLFLSAVSSKKYKDRIHLCGFTVYKKNEHFLVMKVDKERTFDNEIVTCFKIPSKHIEKLSQLFLWERGYVRRGTDDIFTHLRALSSEVKAIPCITLQHQKIGKCVVSRVEASLRTILFNCRTDIFSLSEKAKATPKWNLVHSEPTLEMRKRFVTAMKGEDEGWNQHFDYLFDYYLCRKGKLISEFSSAICVWEVIKYLEIRETFSMDTYISEMLKNGGQIPTKNDPFKEEKTREIDPLNMLNNRPIKEATFVILEDTLEENEYKIKLFNERLPFIKIQRAREITQYIISRLDEKNQEINAEIKRRKKAKEFKKRVDMLVLALSLKENDRFFKAKEEYQLLFSTYIKMIENDQDDFFIEKERKAKIIQSLERTKAFDDFERKEQLQTVFEEMSNDDPTDFMLFLSTVSSTKHNVNSIHLCGFTVYKKNEHFLVMKVDKQRSFDNETVTCFKIPSGHIVELSQLFWGERGYVRRGTEDIFKSLADLSSEVKAIPAITMQHQKTENCVTSEVEASLRTILFNCRTDIFNLSEKAKVTPKWNLGHYEPTIEMRKRFVTAMKGEDEGWDQHFDYLFDYYLCRKGKLVSGSSLATCARDVIRCLEIQEAFSMDTYISEMLKNGGQIPMENGPFKEEKIRGIDPSNMLNHRSIKEVDYVILRNAIEGNEYKIKLLNERLPFIKIQRAEEITRYIISRLEDKNQEIDAELQRRKEIEMKAKEFEKRVDMLALTLSLKENDQFFQTGKCYQLLFSTYIKMIENDRNDFFIEKDRKEKIIQSLERTKAFYDFVNIEQLQSVFEKMTNDDPTDFMLFPIAFLTSLDKTKSHLCGFTVYKKNEDFLVMKVDKDRSFDNKNVTYFKIPSKNTEKLSRLFFETCHYIKILEPFAIFLSLLDLSNGFKTIPAITMQHQKTRNCVVSEVEASLRMILFNCRTDILSLSEKAKVTPKWNLAHSESTLEMRKRFLFAVKGEHKDWNRNFGYIFDYYLYRKGKLGEGNYSYDKKLSSLWYEEIQSIFSMDLYILETLNNGGQIRKTGVPLLQKNISGIDPPQILYGRKIKKIDSMDLLEYALTKNTDKINLFKARLSSMKIPRAKEITRYIISCLKYKNKEIELEIQRREEIKKRRENEKYSKQTLNQLVSKVTPNRSVSHSQSISGTLNEESTLSFLIGRAFAYLIGKRSENESQKRESLVNKNKGSISRWCK
ncbi:hypothetical protein E1H99_00340 [Enterococcus hirae]|nr:hypothetical protein E1H99_00340 [Enterococcus hirae]